MNAEPIDLPKEGEFALGGLRVQPAVRQVAGLAGVETLEPRVMEVLVALARAEGEVVSRDELIAACWGGRIVGEDAIQRCVQRLRRVQELQGGFAIETIAKVGYRLVAANAAPPKPAAAGAVRPTPPEGTIAVLPFVNISPDPEQEYFSDGLSEELMTQLAQLRGLRVTGRTSAFAYKGHNEDLRRIGEKLGVAHILEGSVRKAGSRLRIAAQLVKCADGYQLWSQTYDRELDDVFAIQAEIAAAVSTALSVTLGLGAHYGGTKVFAAYDQFLRGRIAGIEADVVELRRHADHLRQAVALDPGYAVAWADLASLLARLQSQLPSAQARAFSAERDQAAARALALAPELAEAHVAEGWRRANDREWQPADAAFQRGAALAPRPDPLSVGVVGGFISGVGRLREGLPFREGARDADPLALLWSFNCMSSYMALGMTAAFEAEYARSQGLAGDYRRRVEALYLLHLMQTGASAESVANQFERVIQGPSPAPFYVALARAQGDPEAALAVLRQSLHDGPSPRQLIAIAELAGLHGDVDLALRALARAEPDVTVAHLHMLWRPALREARRDPRFKELMRAFGLAQFWRASGKWPDFARPVGADDFEFTA